MNKHDRIRQTHEIAGFSVERPAPVGWAALVAYAADTPSGMSEELDPVEMRRVSTRCHRAWPLVQLRAMQCAVEGVTDEDIATAVKQDGRFAFVLGEGAAAFRAARELDVMSCEYRIAVAQIFEQAALIARARRLS